MKQHFTQNQLVRFLYHELPPAKMQQISEAIPTNWRLYEAYEELRRAYAQLPKVSFQPTTTTLSNILRYSQQTPNQCEALA